MWIEKAKFQIAEIYIHRKISEPDAISIGENKV